MVSVIFPAAGQGRRMGLGFNKIFTELAGKPVLLQTLLTFSRCSCVDELIIVVNPNDVDGVRGVLKRVPGLKPFTVVGGGTERQYSVYNGLMAVAPDSDIVLVHDAARPMVTEQMIKNTVDEVMLSGTAVCAVPSKDTIAEIDESGCIKDEPDRSKLWSVQTPQGFRKELLMQAHKKAKEDGFLGTDDASLVLRLPHPVRLIMGSYENIKITTPADLLFAEMMFGRSAAQELKFKMSSMLEGFLGKRQ